MTLERNKENSEVPDYGPSQADGITIPAYNHYNPFVDFSAVQNPNGALVNALRLTLNQENRTSICHAEVGTELEVA